MKLKVDSVKAPSESFLHESAEWLQKDQARNNLLLGLCYRTLLDPTFRQETYIASARCNGQIAAQAWRTNFPKLSLAETSDLDAVASLALKVRKDMPDLPCAIGPEKVIERFLEAWLQPSDLAPERGMSQLIYKLDRVAPTSAVRGKLRIATEREIQTLLDWFDQFIEEANVAEQRTSMQRVDNIRRRVREGNLFIWDDGEPVCMVGASGPPGMVARVGPVYTPPEKRRRGYASAATAAVSQLMLDKGHPICCLYTDATNPTSNHIYQEVGYKPVCKVEEYWFRAEP